MTQTDPYPERTPCLFEGCNISTEEHHRLNRGLRAEVEELKRKVANSGDTTLDLEAVSDDLLLSEVKRRFR